jgi:hypothetical protein
MPGSTHAVPSIRPSRLPGAVDMGTQHITSPARLLPAFDNERLHLFQPQHPFNLYQSSPPFPHRLSRSCRPRAVSAASVTNTPDYRVWSQGLNIVDSIHTGDQSLRAYRSPPPPPDLDDTASVFSFGAYCRDDNAFTPRIDDHTSPDDFVINIPSTPRMEQLNSEATLSLSTHFSKTTTVTTIGTIRHPDSPSSIRRSRRPAPLNLERAHRSSTSSPIVQEPTDGVEDVTCTPNSRGDQGYSRISRREADVLPRVAPSVAPEVEYVKGIDLQLWIDQEEYRMIRPVFHLKKHSQRPTQRRPSTGVGDRFTSNIGELGLVELRMTSRDVGTFHVGVRDSVPSLVAFPDLCNRKRLQKPVCGGLLSTTMILPTICRKSPCYHSLKMESTQSMAWRSIEGRRGPLYWFGNLNIRSKISVCLTLDTLSLVKRFFTSKCRNYRMLTLS